MGHYFLASFFPHVACIFQFSGICRLIVVHHYHIFVKNYKKKYPKGEGREAENNTHPGENNAN